MKWFSRQSVTMRAAIVGAVVAALSSSVMSPIGEKILGPNKGTSSPDWTDRPSTDSGLRLVDVRLERVDGRPTLDVKFRNISEKPAFIKEVSFRPDGEFVMYNVGRYYASYVGPRQSYNVLLTNISRSTTIPLSQVVPGEDVDRFNISIARPLSDIHFHLIRFTVTFTFDEDNKTVTTPSLLARFDFGRPYSYYSLYDYQNHTMRPVEGFENWRNVTRINKTVAANVRSMDVIMDPGAVELLEAIEGIQA